MKEPDRILNLKQVTEMVGLSKGPIYAMMKLNQFPLSIPLSDNPKARAVGWSFLEVTRWIAARKRNADQVRTARLAQFKDGKYPGGRPVGSKTKTTRKRGRPGHAEAA